VFFSLSSWTVALIIAAVVGGITAVGVRPRRGRSPLFRQIVQPG
jgi:hypothetical protein